MSIYKWKDAVECLFDGMRKRRWKKRWTMRWERWRVWGVEWLRSLAFLIDTFDLSLPLSRRKKKRMRRRVVKGPHGLSHFGQLFLGWSRMGILKERRRKKKTSEGQKEKLRRRIPLDATARWYKQLFFPPSLSLSLSLSRSSHYFWSLQSSMQLSYCITYITEREREREAVAEAVSVTVWSNG